MRASWTLLVAWAMAATAAATTDGASAQVRRGAYLANGVAHCFSCHSPLDDRDPAVPRPRQLGSGDVLDAKAPINAPNLTPDAATGLGGWSDRDIARAIREGIGRDGLSLGTHPTNYYSVMTDEDVAAITAYLRTLRPIRRRLARSARPGRQHESVQPVSAPAKAANLRTPLQRGAYLVQIGECAGCHTPAHADGNPMRDLMFGGGRRFRVEKGIGDEVAGFDPVFTSAREAAAAAAAMPVPATVVASKNLTPDPSGIPYFTAEIFIQTIRTGRVAGVRPLSAAMPWVFFRSMTDADLRDVFAYLQSLRPVQHRVNNDDEPTFCPRCGRRHGLGALNVPAR